MVLTIVSFVEAQNGKVKDRKVAVCHKSQLIWINYNDVQNNLSHGDVLGVQNSAGEWICPPCEPIGELPRTFCPDGMSQKWVWDPSICKWIAKDCVCEPVGDPPRKECPGSIVIIAYWDYTKCEWFSEIVLLVILQLSQNRIVHRVVFAVISGISKIASG